MKTRSALTRSLLGGVAGLALLLSACGASTATTPQVVKGGTATFAEPPAAPPNYIFPLMSLQYFSVSNLGDFIDLMYRPLYWFGQNGKAQVNPSLSLAQLPIFTVNSSGDSVATVNLKKYMWSDGTAVTSRDVEFWMKLLVANKANWAAYVPGAFPDNVTSVTYPSPTQIVFTFNKTYNQNWLLYNELSQITPIPQQVWDVTAAHPSTVGNYDLTPSGAVAVYNYLTNQSKTPSTFATNPLWRVIDGPWTLQSFSNTGEAVFVPNKRYSGPIKPKLSKFIEVPYTSDTAEFNALHSGAVDYGYLPTQDLSQKAYLSKQGYSFAPWVDFGFTYFPLNFTNRTVGPIFNQLYVRQAIQEMVNQPQYIRDIFHGYAVPSYGPVPVVPANPFASPYEKSNPYPYNPTAAKTLLTSHGWAVHPNGVTTCVNPTLCGAGIKKGAGLNFSLLFASGVTTVTSEMEALQSSLSTIGIKVTLSQKPFNAVLSVATPCPSTGPNVSKCTWQMANWGGGWVYAPDYYPSGGEILAAGAGSNSGGYNDPVNNANIVATHTQLGTAAMFTYEDYVAKMLPVIFLPSADYSLSEYKSTLHGVVPQDAYLNLNPENWYFTKG